MLSQSRILRHNFWKPSAKYSVVCLSKKKPSLWAHLCLFKTIPRIYHVRRLSIALENEQTLRPCLTFCKVLRLMCSNFQQKCHMSICCPKTLTYSQYDYLLTSLFSILSNTDLLAICPGAAHKSLKSLLVQPSCCWVTSNLTTSSFIYVCGSKATTRTRMVVSGRRLFLPLYLSLQSIWSS